ncbi:uncharacterized protein [Solanum lycopersicum]|uniref:uncharacterized protein n=1 Tax=Solanum lycopersicum TaxID=4081 RepID=UPI0037486614
MAPCEALYGRRCRSPIGWFDVGEPSLLGPYLIYKTLENVHIIRNRLEMAYSRQKTYVDNRRKDMEFLEGDKVYLKISPMKRVVRFVKEGKLSPRYVGPYEILKRVGKVAYELKLPNEFASVHPVFHVSMLKKCIGDPESIIPIVGVSVKDNLFHEEVSIQILDRQIKKLRNKEVVSVKVLWKNQLAEGATWEAEADMKSLYAHLF